MEGIRRVFSLPACAGLSLAGRCREAKCGAGAWAGATVSSPWGTWPWPRQPARCETDKTSMHALFSSPGLGSGQWAALIPSVREAESDVACMAGDSACGPFCQTVRGPGLVSEFLSRGTWPWSLFCWN